jgi:hypothetical protein
MIARLLAVSVTASILLMCGAGSADARTWNCHSRRAQATEASQSWLVQRATNTTCAHAHKLFVEVSRWSDHSRLDLGAPGHPNTLGYRCTAHVLGDSYWRMRCVRGTHVVVAQTGY